MSSLVTADAGWTALRAQLPADLATSAFQYGALLRKRRRGIVSAEALLRCVLAYTCEHSLRATAAWATLADIASVSDVALLERFRYCGAWLGHLIAQLLPQEGSAPGRAACGCSMPPCSAPRAAGRPIGACMSASIWSRNASTRSGSPR